MTADLVDLTVVVPTRDRWPGVLARTLAALRDQSVSGFETIVVVDGTDQRLPPDLPARVVVKDHGGPGAARNAGAQAATRSLLLFLGDDMVPTPELVARHLAAHAAHPGREVGVLGHVDWHPDVARNRILRWLSWSGSQFDYRALVGHDSEDVGFGRFYSCNVSLDRAFFLDAGGFDEAFTFCYEDLDCGWRLHQAGLRLLYEPQARALHLHTYDWAGLQARFEAVAEGERLMAAKHDWFTPFFRQRVERAAARPRVSGLWPRLVDWVPTRATRLRRAAEARADTWYYQRLAPSFLAAWDGTAARQAGRANRPT